MSAIWMGPFSPYPKHAQCSCGAIHVNWRRLKHFMCDACVRREEHFYEELGDIMNTEYVEHLDRQGGDYWPRLKLK